MFKMAKQQNIPFLKKDQPRYVQSSDVMGRGRVLFLERRLWYQETLLVLMWLQVTNQSISPDSWVWLTNILPSWSVGSVHAYKKYEVLYWDCLLASCTCITPCNFSQMTCSSSSHTAASVWKERGRPINVLQWIILYSYWKQAYCVI